MCSQVLKVQTWGDEFCLIVPLLQVYSVCKTCETLLIHSNLKNVNAACQWDALRVEEVNMSYSKKVQNYPHPSQKRAINDVYQI